MTFPRHRKFFLLVALAGLSWCNFTHGRTWKTSDGKHSIEAEYVDLQGTSIRLRNDSSQKVITVPLAQLRKSDQRYVQRIEARKHFASKSASQVSGHSRKVVSNRSVWSQLIKIFSKDGHRFNPVLIDGVPIVGRLPDYYLSRDQRMNRATENKQVATILTYLCDREVMQRLGKASESQGGREALSNYRTDYFLFSDIVSNFGVREHFTALHEALGNSTDGFEADKGISNMLGHFEQKLSSLQVTETIELYLAAKVGVQNYDRSQSRFPLRLYNMPMIPSIEVPSSMSSVKLTYLPKVSAPEFIELPLDEAKVMYEKLGGKQAVILTKVKLSHLASSFQKNDNSIVKDGRVRTAKIEVVEMTLHSDDKNFRQVYRFPLGNQEVPTENNLVLGRKSNQRAPISEESDPVVAKMQQLAKEFRLGTLDGIPVIRTDTSGDSGKKATDYKERFGKMLDRIALGLEPEHFSPQFAGVHFPETIGSLVFADQDRFGRIGRCDWAGGNQFEKKDSQKKFFEQNDAKLESLKIQTPVRFAVMVKSSLGAYDFEREGFYITGFESGFKVLDGEYLHGLPVFSSFRGSAYGRRFQFIHRPVYVRPFLPMKPELARKYVGSEGHSPVVYIVGVVNLKSIPDETQHRKFPPLLADLSSVTIFKDAKLTNVLAELPCLSGPASVFADPQKAIYPTPQHPATLDRNLLVMLHGLASGQPPHNKLLDDLLQRSEAAGPVDLIAYTWRSNIDLAGHTGQHPEQYKEVRLELQQLTTELKGELKNAPSPFYPNGYSPVEIGEIERSAFMKWQKKRLESSQNRFTISANITYDPLTQSGRLHFFNDPSKESHGEIPAIKMLTDRGDEWEQLVVVDELYTQFGELRSVLPILRFPMEIDEILESLPTEIAASASDDPHGDSYHQVILQLTVKLEKTEMVEMQGEYDSNGLVLHVNPISVRVFSGRTGEELFADKVEYASTRPSIARRGYPVKKAKKPSATKKATPLTPALMPWLIIKHQPILLEGNAPQFLQHRWEQENNFRKYPNQSEAQIDPSLGIFFRANVSKPSDSPKRKLLNEFKHWAQQRSEQLGNRFTLHLETTFGHKVESTGGWPRAVEYRLGNDFDGELSAMKRSLDTEKHMRAFDEGLSGGGFGGGLGGSGKVSSNTDFQKTKALLTRLKAIEQNSQIPLPEINLSGEVYNSGGRFVIPNLGGSVRLSKQDSDFGQATGAWDPDALMPMEPIHPLLQVDKEIWLPEDAGIDPGKRNFVVEIEFTVDRGTLADSPPEASKEAIGEFATDESGEDIGRYVILSSRLERAWILHPKTKKRLVQLELRKYRQPMLIGSKPPKSEQEAAESTGFGNVLSLDLAPESPVSPTPTPIHSPSESDKLLSSYESHAQAKFSLLPEDVINDSQNSAESWMGGIFVWLGIIGTGVVAWRFLPGGRVRSLVSLVADKANEGARYTAIRARLALIESTELPAADLRTGAEAFASDNLDEEFADAFTEIRQLESEIRRLKVRLPIEEHATAGQRAKQFAKEAAARLSAERTLQLRKKKLTEIGREIRLQPSLSSKLELQEAVTDAKQIANKSQKLRENLTV